MKIAIFSDNFYPELSGISDSIIASGQAFAKRGHEVHYFAPRYSATNYALINRADDDSSFGDNIFVHRFPSWPYPAPTKQGRLVIPTLWRWRNLKKYNFDVIHTQDFFGVGLEALVAAKMLKIPLVGTSHTPITEFTSYGPFNKKLIDSYALRYVAWYYNHCAFVSAPSRGVLTEMEQYGFNQSSRAISNPLDAVDFFPVAKEVKKNLKKKYGLSDFTVLYTGRMAKEKRVDDIIRAIAIAAKNIPVLDLVLAGSGQAEADLKKLAQELKIDDLIKYFGFVDPVTHAELYQASDVFAVMSTAETQCLSMMKGMAAALPVIGARARGLTEYINEQNGFLVEPGDPQALADKLEYLYSNPDAVAKLGQGGREFSQNFTPEKIAQIWEKIFNDAKYTPLAK